MRGMIVAQRWDGLDSDEDEGNIEGKKEDTWRLACAASSNLVNGSLASNLDFSSDVSASSSVFGCCIPDGVVFSAEKISVFGFIVFSSLSFSDFSVPLCEIVKGVG